MKKLSVFIIFFLVGCSPVTSKVYKIESNNVIGNFYNDLEIPKVFEKSINSAFSTIHKLNSKVNNHFFIEPLSGGYSKANLFKVEMNGKKYVLRLLDYKRPLDKRKNEIIGHKIGEKLNIAPKIIYSDLLVILMEFIEGRNICSEDLNNKKIVSNLMKTIKKLHQYNNGKNLSKKTKIEDIKFTYKRNINVKKVVYPSVMDDLHKKLQKNFEKFDTKRVPIHGDLSPWNIILTKSGKIYLIDWADPKIDNPFLDIGWLACFTGAGVDQIKILLKEYLNRNPKESEIKKTLFFKDVTCFRVAVFLIGSLKEKDQKTLDTILEGISKNTSNEFKKYKTIDEIYKKENFNIQKYSLGWLKDLFK